MGKATRACQGDCGATRPLHNVIMAKDKNKLNERYNQRQRRA